MPLLRLWPQAQSEAKLRCDGGGVMWHDDADAYPAAGRDRRRGRRRLPRIVRIAVEDGVDVCARCEIADRPLPRMRGLLGRRELEQGHGILLTPAPSVMTFFMRFAIDVVFLNPDRRIVGISHDLKPWRVAGARRAFSALELPAGTAAEKSLRIGDVLLVSDADAAE